jgi:hypothetical protein
MSKAAQAGTGMPPLYLPEPTESVEQQNLFQWAALQSSAHPEVAMLYHIPNGGARSKATAGRLKAEGVRAGVPDLCLPVPRGPYHGLYIELKRRHGGQVSPAQRDWLNRLRERGYAVSVCRGWEDAAQTIMAYLRQAVSA